MRLKNSERKFIETKKNNLIMKYEQVLIVNLRILTLYFYALCECDLAGLCRKSKRQKSHFLFILLKLTVY